MVHKKNTEQVDCHLRYIVIDTQGWDPATEVITARVPSIFLHNYTHTTTAVETGGENLRGLCEFKLKQRI